MPAFFFFSGDKSDPKNVGFWKNILAYFSKNLSKKFSILVKKWLILQDFSKFKGKRKFSQNGKFGSVVLVKQVFCFVLFCCLYSAQQKFLNS